MAPSAMSSLALRTLSYLPPFALTCAVIGVVASFLWSL